MTSEAERALCAGVRDFGKRTLSASVQKLDTQFQAEPPWAMLAQADELGLTLATAPEELGGVELGLPGAALAVEELAAVCPGFATIIASSFLGIAPLILAGDSARAKGLLDLPSIAPATCKMAAIVIPDTGRTPAVKATECGDGYVLNGSALFVYNAGAAGLCTVLAATDQGMIWLAVRLPSSGLRLSAPIRKLGLNIVCCNDLHFEGTRTGLETVLLCGAQAEAALKGIEIQRHGLVGALAVGCTRAALHEADIYSRQRRQGGQIIAAHDAVRNLLMDIEIGLAASKALLQQSLGSADNIVMSVVARILATETACQATTNAVQVFGGYGYTRDFTVEKLMRDSRQLALIGGSNSWLRVWIAQQKETGTFSV